MFLLVRRRISGASFSQQWMAVSTSTQCPAQREEYSYRKRDGAGFSTRFCGPERGSRAWRYWLMKCLWAASDWTWTTSIQMQARTSIFWNLPGQSGYVLPMSGWEFSRYFDTMHVLHGNLSRVLSMWRWWMGGKEGNNLLGTTFHLQTRVDRFWALKQNRNQNKHIIWLFQAFRNNITSKTW